MDMSNCGGMRKSTALLQATWYHVVLVACVAPLLFAAGVLLLQRGTLAEGDCLSVCPGHPIGRSSQPVCSIVSSGASHAAQPGAMLPVGHTYVPPPAGAAVTSPASPATGGRCAVVKKRKLRFMTDSSSALLCGIFQIGASESALPILSHRRSCHLKARSATSALP